MEVVKEIHSLFWVFFPLYCWWQISWHWILRSFRVLCNSMDYQVYQWLPILSTGKFHIKLVWSLLLRLQVYSISQQL